MAWGERDLAQRGRKRKAGLREPSGKLARGAKNEQALTDMVRTSRQPHRRTVKEQFRLTTVAESPLGRMALQGVIEEQLLVAAELFARDVGSYRATIETPRATAGSGRGFQCAVEWSGNVNACAETFECACRSRRKAYTDAYEALMEAAGRRVTLAIMRVAIHREEIAREEIVYLVLGLRVLERHYGLTPKGAARNVRNAH